MRRTLLDHIQKHNLKPNDKLPSESELIEALGYSRTTIRRALNLLKDEGIIYSSQGKGFFITSAHMSSPPPTHISLLFTAVDFDSSYFGILQGIESFLADKHCHLDVCTLYSREKPEIPEKILSDDSAPVIVLPWDHDAPQNPFLPLLHSQKNVVFMDSTPGDICGHLVTSNNTLGGYLATKHLLEQGFKNIAVVLPYELNKANRPVLDRYKGYLVALQEQGIPPYCVPLNYSNQIVAFETNILNLLSARNKLEAVFAINDILASDILKACLHLGIRIPQDLAIIGYDDLPLCTKAPVPLSTIRQNFFDLGYFAAQTAYSPPNAISGSIQQLFLPIELVPRASTVIEKQ